MRKYNCLYHSVTKIDADVDSQAMDGPRGKRKMERGQEKSEKGS